jgi:toxin HigB-1
MLGVSCQLVIRSWKDTATQRFAESGKGRWSGLDVQRARLRLSQLEAAKTLDDLGHLRSVGLHKLSRDRSDHWAITINGPWRLVFRFHAGDAHDVEIVDYH